MSVEAWTLLRPWWLLALPLIGWLFWRWRGREDESGPWVSLVDPALRPRVLGLASGGGGAQRRLVALAGLLSILALAGPAIRDEMPDIAWRADASRVLLVDLSPAMAGDNGERPSPQERLDAVLVALLKALPGGDTALVVYADSPFVAVPPSRDPEVIARYLPELDPRVMPRPGDSPARALSVAGELLQRSGAARRDIVWITAGATVPAELRREELADISVQIIDLGNGAMTDLERLAAGAGWRYLRPGPGVAEIEAMAATLKSSGWKVAPGAADGRYRDFGPWLLLALLPLAALSLSRRVGGLGLMVALALFGGSPPAQATDDAEAFRRWQAGDYAAAAERFVAPRWRAAALHRLGQYTDAAALLAGLDDAEAHYNRGVALARAGELAGALHAFEAALDRRPDDEDARFNRDLLRELMNPPLGKPPPSGAPESSPAARRPDTQREAALLAEQWLRRGVSDEPELLQRRLALEQRRRDSAAEIR